MWVAFQSENDIAIFADGKISDANENYTFFNE